MVKDPQSISPVISSRILNTQLLGQIVKNAAEARLFNRVRKPNSSPNIITQGRMTKPRATISNDLVAAIAAYSPAPGRNPARAMRLDIQNTPGSKVDKVTDAIQRYLNIRPRREPTADPLDEASIARHPQQIVQSSGRWNDARYYKLAKNGLETYQFQPGHRTWAGQLELKLENAGQANIAASASRSPLTIPSTLGQYVTHDPAYAAQSAMGEIKELLNRPSRPAVTVGPPIITDNPYFDPAFAGQNAMRKLRQTLSPSGREGLKVGPVNMTDDPANDPSFAGQKAMGEIRDALEAPIKEPLKVGPVNMSENPYTDPAFAGENAMRDLRANMEKRNWEPQVFWPPNQVEDVLSQPDMIWKTASQTTHGLLQAEGTRGGAFSADYRPLAHDQAFIRALRVIDDINKIFPGARAFGGWA